MDDDWGHYAGLYVLVLFFFFQAEDGIRDLTVTGVQTCALPICPPCARTGPWPVRYRRPHIEQTAFRGDPPRAATTAGPPRIHCRPAHRVPHQREIGRASCRERV